MNVSASVERWKNLRSTIAQAARDAGRQPQAVELVAVSKVFGPEAIWPVIDGGQRVFGENRVQEAAGKWPQLRERLSAYNGEQVTLHLIGPLQSNKARDAVALFDRIETVDREKIAGALSNEMHKQGRQLPCLVQVNTGDEPQKAGVSPDEATRFVERCKLDHGLAVDGLMCIPPAAEDPANHFDLLARLAEESGLPIRSMGMSGDFTVAIAHGATHVRLGSAIFGDRPPYKPAG
ncbi:MAG: YggS family pyridoxal phosphate-dependent enzyme [Pseudomonadota bacterium]